MPEALTLRPESIALRGVSTFLLLIVVCVYISKGNEMERRPTHRDFGGLEDVCGDMSSTEFLGDGGFDTGDEVAGKGAVGF